MAIADFIEPAIKDYATQATATYSAPIDTSKFTGRQFVAGEDPLQTQAINIAQQGVGSYQPFLSAAQAAQSLGAQQIRDAAVGSGNFGGGREGAMLGQYQSDVLGDRAALQAQLLSQGFGHAQQAAQQNFANQGAIANMQSNLANAYRQQAQNMYGLSNFQRQGMGQDVSALGSLGALRQGLSQAQLTADQQAEQTAAYEPYGRLSQYGNTLTGLAGGVAGQQYTAPAPASPFSTALSTALGVGGLYGKIFG